MGKNKVTVKFTIKGYENGDGVVKANGLLSDLPELLAAAMVENKEIALSVLIACGLYSEWEEEQF